MTNSAVEIFHTLLVEDEEKQKLQASLPKTSVTQHQQDWKDLKNAWRRHRTSNNKTGRVQIPASLYQCPLSAPQTTLMPWALIPHPIRQKLLNDNKILYKTDEEEANRIVEVPLAYLQPSEDSADTKKPSTLAGNTFKLTEYARGVVGQCRPHKAGGFDVESKDDQLESEKQEQLMQELHEAREVLKKGATASWRDGTLLTAPPGVGFSVGLGWKHRRPAQDGQDDETQVPYGVDKLSKHEVMEDVDDIKESAADDTEGSFVTTNRTTVAQGAGMWDKALFEDDSLFGDSSSSEEESEDEEDEKDEEEISPEGGSSEQNEPSDIALTPSEPVVEMSTPPSISTQVEEVDDLLAQLALSDSHDTVATARKKTASHPLQLALQQQQQAASDAASTTRKSWASTQLLPISDFHSTVPNPAMTFPFTLDDFQQQAVARLERAESIFVAAHTSAGKTVCAEYAVALCRQHGTRAVYTSPIKALSNQKFRDFCTKFGADQVGLITGDLQLNVDESTVLIMTTEILRSMLYRGADLIRDIEWVIFDEVHYVNDTERGVVWEEVIIMLPPYVNCIFLSATTPNTIEFSDWIGRTKRKPVHVIRTNYRPVPLSHYLWAGLKLHKIREGKGGFLEKGHKEAARTLQPASANTKKGDKSAGSGTKHSSGAKHMAWQAQGNRQNWQSLIKFLDREGLTPAIVFSFSKKKCEEIAYMLRSLDLNTGSESSAVHAFTIQTVARLSPNDATLPQVLSVCEMCKRGIGIHHGGLLPILKEMVEILFSRNLIKVLFATETFAMGVNMPAKAVVFNSIRKHDGTQFRVLEPGEYTQCAGRAGRRGIDSVGTVILCCFGDEPPPTPILRHMLTGSSTKLSSQFRLTYNMILNLLRVEDMSVEGMIKRSFSEFATQRALTANEYPKLLARGEKTLTKLDDQFVQEANTRIGAEDLEDYFSVCVNLLRTNSELLSYIAQSVGGSNADVFVPGRVILVTSARKFGFVRAPALVLRSPTMLGSDSGSSSKPCVCMVLLPESYIAVSSDETETSNNKTKPGSLNYIGSSNNRHYALREINFDEILFVSSKKHKKVDVDAVFKEAPANRGMSSRLGQGFGNAIPVSRQGRNDFDSFMGVKARGKRGGGDSSDLFLRKPQDLSNASAEEEETIAKLVGFLVEAEENEAKSSLGVMDLRDSVKQGSDLIEFRKQCGEMEALVERMRTFVSHHLYNLERHYAVLERKETLRLRVDTLRHLLSNESLQLFPDFLQRKALLRTLGYVDENETVCTKGRVACEVNTCEELIVTEMVFEGILNGLEPAEIVAALSALVFQEKQNQEDFDAELPESLLLCCQQMKKIATHLGQLQKEHGLDIDPGEYCDGSLKFGLVHVVYEWALGVPFSSICELTLVQEGSIVRCITRLDELCREVRNCARVVGNPTLYRKMEAASTAIKRDIVFASSLYVS